jgi:hypothetical protein
MESVLERGPGTHHENTARSTKFCDEFREFTLSAFSELESLGLVPDVVVEQTEVSVRLTGCIKGGINDSGASVPEHSISRLEERIDPPYQHKLI